MEIKDVYLSHVLLSISYFNFEFPTCYKSLVTPIDSLELVVCLRDY